MGCLQRIERLQLKKLRILLFLILTFWKFLFRIVEKQRGEIAFGSAY